ncbi:MAG: hypothetical protein K1X47_03475 [Cyclobacteriaceae bacterium]|nr:hypothetical protein [Cyclobacteriaceae bacterium]
MKLLRYSSLALALILAAGSCTTESGVKPPQAPTFLRYLNGGNNDIAVVAQEKADGSLVLLSNIEITSGAGVITRKVKVTNLDKYGNQVGNPAIYPSDFSATDSYEASDLIITSGGYIIHAEHIYTTKASGSLIATPQQRLVMLTLDASGNFSEAAIAATHFGEADTVKAVSVIHESAGLALNPANNNIMLLGWSASASAMLLSEVNASGAVQWAYQYPTPESTVLSKRLVVDGAQQSTWMRTASGGVRIVNAPANTPTTGDILLSKNTLTESVSDMCSYGGNFALVGTTNANPDGTPGTGKNIFYRKVTPGSEVTTSVVLDLTGNNITDEEGQSLCVTQTGEVVLLGTTATSDRGTDYYLIKLDAFGNRVWERTFGSRGDDEGASVRQLSDGSYLIFGSTTLAGLKTLMVMKADKDGLIK